jgi:Zn finger protein HypA/HybF involved in hydrogenase expression
MQDKPYFCPNCRSNRVKFSIISSYSQKFLKDAITGEVKEMSELNPIEQAEPDIQCLVCNFIGNEMRFVKQAEREPRPMTPTHPGYF